MPDIQLTSVEIEMILFSAIGLLSLGWFFRQIYKLVK
jgi:hypothetical protein